MTEYRWRKASRSTGSEDCVEVAIVGSGAVRDSKNPAGPILAVDLSGLLVAAKDGRLDR
jgi:Domain of unknown function (DUF397)